MDETERKGREIMANSKTLSEWLVGLEMMPMEEIDLETEEDPLMRMIELDRLKKAQSSQEADKEEPPPAGLE